MNVFSQWLLVIVAFTGMLFLAIKGKNLNNKKILFLISIGMAIIYVIDTYGTIGFDKTMSTLFIIAMWISIIALSSFFIFIKDIKKLAMVLYIPGVFILFRLIDVLLPIK